MKSHRKVQQVWPEKKNLYDRHLHTFRDPSCLTQSLKYLYTSGGQEVDTDSTVKLKSELPRGPWCWSMWLSMKDKWTVTAARVPWQEANQMGDGTWKTEAESHLERQHKSENWWGFITHFFGTKHRDRCQTVGSLRSEPFVSPNLAKYDFCRKKQRRSTCSC